MLKKVKQLAKPTAANKKLLQLNKDQAKDKNAAIAADIKKRASVKKVKVKALINLSGLYNLPYSKDQEFLIDVKQAGDLVENKAVIEVEKPS